MARNYQLTNGYCKDCCLCRECESNKKGIKDFLLKIGILCEYGKCVEVVECDV